MSENEIKEETFDVSRAPDRRRFFLRQALRKRTLGSGSNLRGLMDRPRRNQADMAELNVPATMLVGAHAAAVYAPERHTDDIEILVLPDDFKEAEDRLVACGWAKQNELLFSNTNLGLYGSAWFLQSRPGIDLISSDQSWAYEAFAQRPILNRWKQRVIPLPYLILMKVDSARNLDQADLSRMLGRLEPSAVEEIVAIVARHHPDVQIAEEIRQYAEIGRWEYMSEQEIRGERGRERDGEA
jgi:hypothetical protein